MADNYQNTSEVSTNTPNKAGLVTDLNDSYISPEQYSHARNMVRNSKDGDMGTIGNEPSNQACYKAPYQIVGIIPMPDGLDLVCSTDNNKSEIGIGNRKDCSYKTMSTLDWGFSTDFPVIGVSKKHYRKGVIVTFSDRNQAPKRVEVKKLSSYKNTDEALLFKKVVHPEITIKKGNVGNMPNGAYSVCMAYSVNGQEFSDFYSITNRVLLYSEIGANSLEVNIGGLDQDFDEYILIVVGNYVDPTTKGATKSARVVGKYSTKQSKVSVTDFVNTAYKEIGLDHLVIRKDIWNKVGIVASNSNYLILGDLVKRPEENYQTKAMSIEAEYVVDQVEADYYKTDGADVSFYRDENYDFHIQGVYTTGEETDKFHIGGRRSSSDDLQLVASSDVYELDNQFQDCAEVTSVPRWKVYNTAGNMVPLRNDFKCGRRTIGFGKMGYWESTNTYPDNVATFGKDANQPIRYHKMPDETKVPRYAYVDGKPYINILGVRFKNIPKFDSPDIVGYKITRSDRKGGNGTVVARGILTNVRGYSDPLGNQKVMYSNYTLNDLGPDAYLSSTQTVYKNNKETNFNPLTEYYKDRFNFYSPHTSFEPRYSLGQEVKIESEEIANVKGRFEKVYKHPKMKLLNQFAFWIALGIGIAETYFEQQGLKNQVKSNTNGSMTGIAIQTGVAAGTIEWNGSTPIGTKTHGDTTGHVGGSALSITGQATQDAINDLVGLITAGDWGQIGTYLKTLKDVLSIILSLGVDLGLWMVSIMRYAQEVLNTINNFTGLTDYVYQYNAIADFVQSIPVKEGNVRRRLLKPAIYLPSTIVNVNNEVYNNLLREKSVLFMLNKELNDPSVKDNSRNTLSGFGLQDNINGTAQSTGSAYYATSKVINPNQYGPVGSAGPVSMHSGTLPFAENGTTNSPVLYGGDCIITKFYLQKKMQFFNQNLANTNYDGSQVEYDYRLYRNIAFPRFWLDSTHFDYGELLQKKTINFATFNRTTANKHNLDCKGKDGSVPTRIDNAYMYLSNNCAVEFFVECDYNIDFRDKNQYPYFSKDNSNTSEIFRSDRLENQEEYNINRVFSDIYTTELYANPQRSDFDPLNPVPVSQPNSVIYSLPSFNMQEVDNWQYFLPANYFGFAESDFGKLTAIHKMDQDRLIFLFSEASPYISMGRDFLQLDNTGRKITIGDGGLFAQDPREVMPTDNKYGACNSRFAFSNTHMGKFYPSENQGRIFNFEQGLDDVSRNGMSFWCKNYMPIFLYKYFPNYPQVENPVGGVGYLTAFDAYYETVYICKRDFVPVKQYIADITYNADKGQFEYRGKKISLRDPQYFRDVSWTLSYSVAEKAFVSWHDWNPDMVIQSDNHFLTVKGNTVYKHNEAWDSFCSFYGKDYGFGIEFLSSSGQNVESVRSLEYFLEAYKYKNFGRDRYHVLNENFDHLIVHNSEQISPVLNLTLAPSNPRDRLFYPKKNNSNGVSYDILFEKVEQKYRINQFWDSVKDRSAEVHLLATDESGYRRVVNPVAITDRTEIERKKFRHIYNKFLLVRSTAGSLKFITKIINIKKTISPR